jgi:hypothetical protein
MCGKTGCVVDAGERDQRFAFSPDVDLDMLEIETEHGHPLRLNSIE